MGSYEIRGKASEDLRRLDRQDVVRALGGVDGLAVNPLPPGSRKLQGTEGHRRLRVGSLRVIYQLDPVGRTVP